MIKEIAYKHNKRIIEYHMIAIETYLRVSSRSKSVSRCKEKHDSLGYFDTCETKKNNENS